MAGKKTLYHSELVKCGAVEVEVKTDVLKSKYDGKPDYVAIILDGEERLYNCENEACATFFDDLKGIKLTIQASGGREDALIQEVDSGPARPPAAKPAAQSRPAQRQDPAPAAQTQPPGEVKPLRERLNDPAWGAYNLNEHLRKCLYAAKRITAAVATLPDQTPEGRSEWYRIFFISVEKANLFGNLPTEPAAKPAAAPKPQPKREPEPPPAQDDGPPPDDEDSVPF